MGYAFRAVIHYVKLHIIALSKEAVTSQVNTMRFLLFLKILFFFSYDGWSQLPSCCSQPGACQSYGESVLLNDTYKNSVHFNYSLSQARGYLLLPNVYGDTVYTAHRITQHNVTTQFRLRLTDNAFINLRLPFRYVNNYSINEQYGLGDISIGVQWKKDLKSNQLNKTICIGQLIATLPTGRSYRMDTSAMYKSLLQIGTGNLNLESGVKLVQDLNKQQVLIGLNYRRSLYHRYNYINGSLMTAFVGYAYIFNMKQYETKFQLNTIAERYNRDLVNDEIASNSGYTMITCVPRLETKRKQLSLYTQLITPLYRNYLGRQLKLSYTFTTGIVYGF